MAPIFGDVLEGGDTLAREVTVTKTGQYAVIFVPWRLSEKFSSN